MSHLRILALVAAATLAACGGSDSGNGPSGPSSDLTIPTTPTPEPHAIIEGSWSGTVQDPVAGQGQFSMELQQDGQTVAATWGIVFNNMVHTEGGTLTGQVTGNTLEATARPQAPHSCGFRLTAEIRNNANRIRGDYTVRGCGTIGNGTLNITRGSLT